MLAVIETDLKAQELVSHVDSGPAMEFFGRCEDDAPLMAQLLRPAWVDDYATPAIAPCGVVEKKIIAAVSTVAAAFLKFRLQMNRKVGKTELMIKPYGPGALAVQRRFASLPDGMLQCGADGDTLDIHVTKVYRHMGRRTTAAGGVMQEMSARHGSASKATKKIKFKFYQKSEVAVDLKLQVGNTMVLSRELYGCGAWPVLSTAEAARLHSNVSGHFRTVLGERYGDCVERILTDKELYMT